MRRKSELFAFFFLFAVLTFIPVKSLDSGYDSGGDGDEEQKKAPSCFGIMLSGEQKKLEKTNRSGPSNPFYDSNDKTGVFAFCLQVQKSEKRRKKSERLGNKNQQIAATCYNSKAMFNILKK